jgi:hypothetical protein
MAKADRHRISLGGSPRATTAWLRKYGYRGVGAGMQGTDVGCLFNRPGEPVQLACPGDVLRWDARKKCVVIEVVEYSSPHQDPL